jgi:hypothetical protein
MAGGSVAVNRVVVISGAVLVMVNIARSAGIGLIGPRSTAVAGSKQIAEPDGPKRIGVGVTTRQRLLLFALGTHGVGPITLARPGRRKLRLVI